MSTRIGIIVCGNIVLKHHIPTTNSIVDFEVVAIAKNTPQFQTMRKDFYADTDSL